MCINKRHQLIRYSEVLCWYAESAARSDEFRMNRLKQGYDYRTGAQDEVLIPAGTLTHSRNAGGEPFTYTLKADVKVKEKHVCN